MMERSHLDEKLKTYRLSFEEYQSIQNILGRDLASIEWALFSALWSEHCSYKSSKVHLRKFSYRNEKTPDMEGENAGIVDLGYGEKIAFKMESHNHPSFIEPFQGAATGVGGILRDIFTMGARPIMSANYLCFGEIEAPRMKELMTEVVRGISYYGNCVGVPMVTGQTQLHPRYNKNILVNALSVGYFAPEQKIALAKASGPGNYVVYVGAKTGRDGVHGASMASASFDADADSKKPNVQIGDPFYEKLLIEACLEVLSLNLVVAMQDMGAAGLTSSSFEMASHGKIGLVIDLKKVPLRDSTMSAEDILLSESQERMLLICRPECWEELHQVFKKWNLDAVVLGEVQKEKKVKLLWGVETLVDLDPDLIVEKAPRYERPYESWKPSRQVLDLRPAVSQDKKSVEALLQKAFSTSQLNRYQWIYQQYDQRVGARTAASCDQSVAFVQLDHSARGLGLSLGCRPEIMLMDARLGALDAVYYPSFQLALKGAKPLAMTDCLNFGNPQKNEVMTEFVASVEAIAEASRQLDAPVISGNVSFYNETLGENIISTPAIGVVGLRDHVESILPDQFSNAFESLLMVDLNWVQAFVFLDQLNQQTSHFKMNSSVDVSAFIKRCAELDSEIKKQHVPISCIKAVGLGGVLTTCLKMSTDQVGFDLSYDTAGSTDSDLWKDRFYSFIVSTADADKTMKFLNEFFHEIKMVDIRKIGETIPEKIILPHLEQMTLESFQMQFVKGF